MSEKKKSSKVKVHRSAKDGKFVSKEFAQHHPATTVKETVKRTEKKVDPNQPVDPNQ